jgi:hypothetical protein
VPGPPTEIAIGKFKRFDRPDLPDLPDHVEFRAVAHRAEQHDPTGGNADEDADLLEDIDLVDYDLVLPGVGEGGADVVIPHTVTVEQFDRMMAEEARLYALLAEGDNPA